jgi:thioredoxin 1
MLTDKSESELETLINDTPYIFVDFYADWCGPCKKFEPELVEIEKKYSSQCTFIKMNIDNADELAAQYNISKVPTFLLFSNTKLVARIDGPKRVEIDAAMSNLFEKIEMLDEF